MKGTIIMRSPCLKCDHRNRDKKHPECINCNDRILYADSIGPMTHSMPIELTNLGGAMNEIAQKECKQPGCEMAGKLQPIDNFPRNARCKDGHLDTCKKCMGKKINMVIVTYKPNIPLLENCILSILDTIDNIYIINNSNNKLNIRIKNDKKFKYKGYYRFNKFK